MKQKVLPAVILLLLIFLLRFPEEAVSAAQKGLQLWLNTLIPTLLPFIILTGILIHTNGIEKIFSPLSGIWKILLGLSPNGAYAFLLGMLCGYPMGAKITSDLYKYKKICKTEAEYLLTFCNNPSPAFVIAYLTGNCLKNTVSVAQIFTVLMTSNFLCMLFFRFIIYKNQTREVLHSSPVKKETSIFNSLGEMIDVSIMNGFETITRMGGYILMFSILSAWVGHYWIFGAELKHLFLGTLEITTGLSALADSSIPFQIRLIMSISLTAFGGLCILGQTKSVLDRRISIRPYLSAKCLNAALSAVLSLIFF